MICYDRLYSHVILRYAQQGPPMVPVRPANQVQTAHRSETRSARGIWKVVIRNDSPHMKWPQTKSCGRYYRRVYLCCGTWIYDLKVKRSTTALRNLRIKVKEVPTATAHWAVPVVIPDAPPLQHAPRHGPPSGRAMWRPVLGLAPKAGIHPQVPGWQIIYKPTYSMPWVAPCCSHNQDAWRDHQDETPKI